MVYQNRNEETRGVSAAAVHLYALYDAYQGKSGEAGGRAGACGKLCENAGNPFSGINSTGDGVPGKTE